MTFKSKILNKIAWTFIVIFLAGLSLCVFLIIHPSSYYDLREYFNKNSIEINTENNINKNNITIYWTPETGSTIKVFEKGEELNVIYKEYGPNKFTVTYNQDTVGEFSYFKTANWHGHRHEISLKKLQSGAIQLNVKIYGPDAKDDDYITKKKQ